MFILRRVWRVCHQYSYITYSAMSPYVMHCRTCSLNWALTFKVLSCPPEVQRLGSRYPHESDTAQRTLLHVVTEQLLYLISKQKQFITLTGPVDAVQRPLLCFPPLPHPSFCPSASLACSFQLYPLIELLGAFDRPPSGDDVS